MDERSSKQRIVVVGGGFAGLTFVGTLKAGAAEITLIDQRNHHLFQPLLYQVATASLTPSDIAWPIRHVLRKRRDVRTLLGSVTGVETARRVVRLADGREIPYDTLVLATGARHSYFGHDDWEPFATGLKTVEDATAVRQRILSAFERAECESDPAERAAWMTFVVVGGGPTGVEMAGAIAELAHATLQGEFRLIDPAQARIVLVEAGDRLLPSFETGLSAYARAALERRGVAVRLGEAVTLCDAEGVRLGEERIKAHTLVWAAGVEASPAGEWLGVPTDRAGRVVVEPDLTVPGHPEIFVLGDTAAVRDARGKAVPGIAPAAKQQGAFAARVVAARLAGHTAPARFSYGDRGSLATIGKRAAVIDFGKIRLRGWPAWWLWGLAHVYFLIGVRNRLSVALSWLWIHARDQRPARLITGQPRPAAPAADGAEETGRG